MNNQDKNRFAEIMLGLGDYYKEKIADSTMSIFWEDFKDVSIEDFAKAVSNHRKDPDQGMFFPKVANLMRQINGNAKDKQNQQEAKAIEEWNKFKAHLKYNGFRAPYATENGAALATLAALGGISTLGGLDQSKLNWMEKEFVCLYLANANGGIELAGGTLSIESDGSETKKISAPQKTLEEYSEIATPYIKELTSSLPSPKSQEKTSMTPEQVEARKKEIREQLETAEKSIKGKNDEQ